MPKDRHTKREQILQKEQIKGLQRRSVLNGKLLLLSGVLGAASNFLQANTYFGANPTEGIYKALGEPTFLTSFPYVLGTSSIFEAMFLSMEMSAVNIHNEDAAKLFRMAQMATPIIMIAGYTAVEALGGISNSTGHDTLVGDVLSGLAGGAVSLLANEFARRSESKRLGEINTKGK